MMIIMAPSPGLNKWPKRSQWDHGIQKCRGGGAPKMGGQGSGNSRE